MDTYSIFFDFYLNHFSYTSELNNIINEKKKQNQIAIYIMKYHIM